MTEAFKAHVATLAPGSSEAARLMSAAASPEALLAYSQAHGLDLTEEDAERLVATTSRPLDDAEIDPASGGMVEDTWFYMARQRQRAGS